MGGHINTSDSEDGVVGTSNVPGKSGVFGFNPVKTTRAGAGRPSAAGRSPASSSTPCTSPASHERLVELDEALRRLEQLEPRSASVVELRFFGGMSEKEIAAALDISVPTVKRDWTFARSWLQSRLEPSPRG